MKGPAGSSTAQGPEQSLRTGLLWPRGRGQAEVVTSGWHGMARLTATLGAQPSQVPNPGLVPQKRPDTGVSQHLQHTQNRISDCPEETLFMEHLACARIQLF